MFIIFKRLIFLCYFLIFGACLWYYLRKKGTHPTGIIFGWWLVALFGARFCIEFLKTNGVIEGSHLLMGQWLSLPLIVGGLVIVWLSKKGKFPNGPFPWGETNKIKLNDKNKSKK